jgi:hypothetical protein
VDGHGEKSTRWAGWVKGVGKTATGEKKLKFCQKHSPNCDPYPLSKTYDGWVRREGYGGSDLDEKNFQLSLLIIV